MRKGEKYYNIHDMRIFTLIEFFVDLEGGGFVHLVHDAPAIHIKTKLVYSSFKRDFVPLSYIRKLKMERMNYYYTKDVVVSTPQAQCNHSL